MQSFFHNTITMLEGVLCSGENITTEYKKAKYLEEYYISKYNSYSVCLYIIWRWHTKYEHRIYYCVNYERRSYLWVNIVSTTVGLEPLTIEMWDRWLNHLTIRPKKIQRVLSYPFNSRVREDINIVFLHRWW